MADIYGTTGNDTLTSDGDTIGDSYFGLERDDSITGGVAAICPGAPAMTPLPADRAMTV